MSRARWAEDQLHYRFNDSALLEQALTHRSASKKNNERLEFLGDSFLNFVVGSELYGLRPDASEGDLSRLRATLVRRSTLAAIGQELGISSQVIVGPGEIRTGGAARSSVLANALEALIGAVLIDGGMQAAQQVTVRLMRTRLASLPEAAALKDSKTKLQEWLQGRGLELPVYRVDTIHGRAHEQTFTVVCEVKQRGLQIAGGGPSRRRAEQEAAAAMLAALTDGH
jgi:ribonuclease III